MPIPIDVPGLVAHVGEVPDGRIVLIEGGPDPAKSALARRLAEAAGAQGRKAERWVTAPLAGRPDADARAIEEWPEEWPSGTDVIVDSFSLLAIDLPPVQVATRLRGIRRSCAASGSVAVLVLDEGQLATAAQATSHHLADGIIQFKSREDPEGPVSYLRIPKWMGGAGVGRNLYYDFDGTDILIDTRRRVN